MDTFFATRFASSASASRRIGALAASLAAFALLAGCASGEGGLGKAVSRTLESVGLKDEKVEERRIPLRLYAGENLNAGNGRRGLAAVVKVYHLRGSQRFEQAPFEMFLDEERERQALGADLLGVSEIVLTPGTRHEVVERVPAEAETLAVVALFRAPAGNRWRLAFDARHKSAAKDGVTVGLHACAMTTSSPALTTRLPGDPSSLASVQCQRTP